MKDVIHNTYFFCFFILICFIGYSQNEVKKKVYYIKVINEFAAPTFDKQGSYFEYSGNNSNEEVFFSKYDITAFRQAYPNSNRINLRNAFILETNSSEIASDLLTTFPEIYTAVEDITDQKAELSTTTYIPPDFITSAIRIPFDTITYDRSELLYIDAPKAWGITDTINRTIALGISDAKVDALTDDLLRKVTYINPYGNLLAVDCNNSTTTHGTGTSVIAAGIGDNGEGTTGICYDCDVIATSWEFGYGYNNLLLLAQNGVKVINMSWGVTSSLPPDQYTASSTNCADQQECINEIVEDYGVVLVAASGNDTSFDSNGPNLLYDYPASYNNVISVSSVNHWYTVANYPTSEHLYQPSNGEEYMRYIEDSVARLVEVSDPSNPVGVYSQYWNPDNTYMHTLNEEVDICAPGYQIASYNHLVYNCAMSTDPIDGGKYGSGTSSASPMVTGTIGLMLTINECLTPSEVESILKLTAKDIEVNPMNAFAIGYIGAGKLETGNAVEFVNEMQKNDGIATIKDHIFYRYDFDLQRFNNDLTIENVVFKDGATANFSVKNSIELKEGTHLVPNNDGFISLKADNTINDVCIPTSNRYSNSETQKFEKNLVEKELELNVYPNPTSSNIEIQLNDESDIINMVEVYSTQSQLVLLHKNTTSEETINMNISNLKSGIYIIKTLTKQNKVINSKIIKE